MELVSVYVCVVGTSTPYDSVYRCCVCTDELKTAKQKLSVDFEGVLVLENLTVPVSGIHRQIIAMEWQHLEALVKLWVVELSKLYYEDA